MAGLPTTPTPSPLPSRKAPCTIASAQHAGSTRAAATGVSPGPHAPHIAPKVGHHCPRSRATVGVRLSLPDSRARAAFSRPETTLLVVVRTGGEVCVEARGRNPWQSISVAPPAAGACFWGEALVGHDHDRAQPGVAKCRQCDSRTRRGRMTKGIVRAVRAGRFGTGRNRNSFSLVGRRRRASVRRQTLGIGGPRSAAGIRSTQPSRRTAYRCRVCPEAAALRAR
jgi:hypothetical protein